MDTAIAALPGSIFWTPKDMRVLHGCDKPLCCTTAHPRGGAQADNMQTHGESCKVKEI